MVKPVVAPLRARVMREGRNAALKEEGLLYSHGVCVCGDGGGSTFTC